jgi:capsule polysaccharide export protein KpsE/RkpR
MLGQLGALAGMTGTSIGFKNPNDVYVGMLKSRTVADSLIERFDLQKVYDRARISDTRNVLANATKISSGRDGLITVEVDDREPNRAAALANGYIEELYKLTQTLALTEASHRRLFLENQLRAVKTELAAAEVNLKNTQEATGLIKLDDQGRAIIESVARLQAQIAAKEVQIGAMRAFATEQNPQLLVAQQELTGLRAQLARVEREQKLGSGNVLVPTGKIPEAGLEYARKFRDVKYYETIFEILAKQFEMAKLDEARDSSVIQVLDKAVVPETRSRPARARIVFAMTLTAVILAVVLAFIIEALQRARANPAHAQRLSALGRYLRGR